MKTVVRTLTRWGKIRVWWYLRMRKEECTYCMCTATTLTFVRCYNGVTHRHFACKDHVDHMLIVVKKLIRDME